MESKMEVEKMKTGKIVAVCVSDKPNVPKYPQEEIIVGEYGFIGDIHAGPTRISRRTGLPKFNDRQVSIVSKEALDELNAALEISLKPGDLGENITVEGFGNLSDMKPGMCFQIGVRVLLEITEQNDPCKNLYPYHRLLVKISYSKKNRGVLAIVKHGVGSKIRSGDTITLLG